MVNIRAIIYTNNRGTTTFKGFPEYWSYTLGTSTGNSRKKLQVQQDLSEVFSDAIADKYKCRSEETKNISFLFGSLKEATKRLQDPKVRDLVFNLENQVIIDLVDTNNGAHIVVTIHQENTVHFVTTYITPVTEL